MNNNTRRTNFIINMRKFPDIHDGNINIHQFIDASSDLVSLVERLGKVFAPVKYDMQGNIDKIKSCYELQKNSCLLELMDTERRRGEDKTIEGILWLNRALLFFEIVFQQIIENLRLNEYNIGMANIFTVAYEGSVKKYHNWISQRLFSLVCKMSPALPQILSSLDANEDIEGFRSDLIALHETLMKVRCKIDTYFEANKF